MVAFITGITGQDGSYLAELLLEKGYTVHGLVHRPEGLATGHLRHLAADPKVLGRQLFLHPGAFEDASHLRRLLSQVKPTEFYHLAGQSSPRLSLQLPEATIDSVGVATLRLLEVIRDLDCPPKFLYASSSEIFGSPAHTPQDELTPINPTTPYGAAKALSTQLVKIYRTAWRLPVCSAILYNHESPRRSDQFVTRKVAKAVAFIKASKKAGRHEWLELGALTGRRDWGWAPDYVRGMWLMLQGIPDDFILATGTSHTVEELVDCAFKAGGLDWHDHVRHNVALTTAVEPTAPCGNPTKAQRILGWVPTVGFEEMVEHLVTHETADQREEDRHGR